MRVLVIRAHPVETSFNAALHRTVLEALAAAGHGVDSLDLYDEDFDPRLSRAERLGYHDPAADRSAVQPYIDRLTAAEALVFVHPVWNFGYPAILKGFFDRVFLPGVSFRMQDGRVVPALTNIRKAAIVTTYGGTRLRARLVGDPPRKLGTRVLAATIRRPVAYHALYDLNRATDADRAAFVARVDAAMRAF